MPVRNVGSAGNPEQAGMLVGDIRSELRRDQATRDRVDDVIEIHPPAASRRGSLTRRVASAEAILGPVGPAAQHVGKERTNLLERRPQRDEAVQPRFDSRDVVAQLPVLLGHWGAGAPGLRSVCQPPLQRPCPVQNVADHVEADHGAEAVGDPGHVGKDVACARDLELFVPGEVVEVPVQSQELEKLRTDAVVDALHDRGLDVAARVAVDAHIAQDLREHPGVANQHGRRGQHREWRRGHERDAA